MINLSTISTDSFSAIQFHLLTVLADGEFHSGTALAGELQISRSAIWKHLQGFMTYGIEIHAVSGKGYKLARPLELLDAAQIKTHLSDVADSLVSKLEIYSQITSTNRYLVEQAQHNALSGTVCFAESQTAGRGRHGRTWVSPFGCNMYLSVLWRFESDMSCLAGLSLVVGVMVIRVLKELGIHDVGLKWPNDIVWQGKKLGGILIEVSGEASGECSAVIGLGLNVHLPLKDASTILQPWTDMTQISGKSVLSRNKLAGLLLNHLLPMLADFETQSLRYYLNEWRSYDALINQTVSLYVGTQRIEGIVCGVNEQGFLLLENFGEIKAFASGEVSFRTPI